MNYVWFSLPREKFTWLVAIERRKSWKRQHGCNSNKKWNIWGNGWKINVFLLTEQTEINVFPVCELISLDVETRKGAKYVGRMERLQFNRSEILHEEKLYNSIFWFKFWKLECNCWSVEFLYSWRLPLSYI